MDLACSTLVHRAYAILAMLNAWQMVPHAVAMAIAMPLSKNVNAILVGVGLAVSLQAFWTSSHLLMIFLVPLVGESPDCPGTLSLP
jgi:hypothetical protein